jgi:hypothetical protein
MQAFFVKAADPEAVAVQFDNSMMIDGNAPTLTPAPARQLRLTAHNGRGRSEATVMLGDAEAAVTPGLAAGGDVETLFDSNLADVPMVYTVGTDNRAVSINQSATTLHALPFGVACSDAGPVAVTLSGTSAVAEPLYVLDALTGRTTEIGEGSVCTVQPNDYGRYYLMTATALSVSTDAGSAAARPSAIVVTVSGRQLTVRSQLPLASVRVMAMDGTTVWSANMAARAADAITSDPLQPGICMVEVAAATTRKTVKVILK